MCEFGGHAVQTTTVNEKKAFLLSKDNQVSVLKHLLQVCEQVILTLKCYHYMVWALEISGQGEHFVKYMII